MLGTTRIFICLAEGHGAGDSDLFSFTSCHLHERVRGGKDCLTWCCCNFCRAGMCLSSSVRDNLWLTLTPRVRRACAVGEGRSAVTWHSSSRCLDFFWVVTRKTRDGVGVAGPWEGGRMAVRGHHGGCGCTWKGELQLQPAAVVWCLHCPKYKTVVEPKLGNSCAYHPGVWDGMTRGLMPREQETRLSWRGGAQSPD